MKIVCNYVIRASLIALLIFSANSPAYALTDTSTDFTDMENFEIFSKGDDALVRYQLKLKSLTELNGKWADAVRLAEKLGKDQLSVSGNVKLL
jgi:hypothetical protein